YNMYPLNVFQQRNQLVLQLSSLMWVSSLLFPLAFLSNTLSKLSSYPLKMYKQLAFILNSSSLPYISRTMSNISLSVEHLARSFSAFFSPTPPIPLMLSDLSPLRHCW